MEKIQHDATTPRGPGVRGGPQSVCDGSPRAGASAPQPERNSESTESCKDPTQRIPAQPADDNQTCLFEPPPAELPIQLTADPNQTGEFRLVPQDAGDANQTCEFLPEASPRPVHPSDRTERVAVAPSKPVADAEPAVLPGVHVPGYAILQELGRGGMGVVYKARHLGLNRIVALKMILAGAHAGTSGLARFRAEAAAVAQLQHPNIIQVYETGEHEGRPYFSLEFVEEGSLEERVRESPLTPRAAAELLETLARTMEVAHQHGIIHRDLKPANILLAAARGQVSMVRRSTSGRKSSLHRKEHHSASGSLDENHWARNTIPKIADFGLAKKLDEEASGNTQSGTILGTPSYMAPEQAEGKIHELCPATDIYALGAILYELLTRRPPFRANSPLDTIRQLLTQEPVPPRQLEPGVPHDLETICLKCLEKHPARRYTSGGELADDLRRFLDDEPILARPTPAWERAWKWGKNRPALVALLGVSVLAVVSMVLFVVWHNVSLQGQLDQARAEERLARQREQEALENERLSRVEAEGQKLLHDAQVAAAARDWTNARLHLTRVLATIGDEPRLEKLKEPTRVLLDKAEEHLRLEADRQASQARFKQFGELRDEALFLGCLYTGMDLAANLKATRAVVYKALAVYGIAVASGAAAVPDAPLDTHLSESQKSEVREDCYQLLLILAETEAQSAPAGPAREPHEQVREAVRLLQQALHFGPPSRAYHLRQARYLGRLGDEAGSQREDRAAAAVPVRNVLDHFLVGDEYYRRGSFEEALQQFTQVLQMKPAHFWAQYLSALCLLRLQRPAEARAQLSACLAQRADFVWIYLLRGFAQGELQAFDAAEADFQKALQMPLDQNARYVLFVNRGVLRVRQERFDDAIRDLQTAIELAPKEYQAYVNLAQAYRRQKKLDLALEQLNRAVELEPSVAHLYRLRARLQLERKEPGLALRDFDQAIQRESSDSPYQADDQVERGRLLLLERKPTEALAAFDAALRLRKDHAFAQRLRAEALFQLGRYQEVVEALDRYLAAGGKPLESVYRGRGLALVELGKYPGAIEDYTKALELQPTSEVQTYRGWAHLVVDAPKLALRDFELAIQLDPKNADAHAGRGFVLAKERRFREAVRDADEALRLGPQSSRLVYNVARILAQCPGDNDLRALDLLRKALGLLPANQRSAFWSTYVRSDAALQAIRRHPRFVELDAELSRK